MKGEITDKTSLWILGLSPLVWSLHFLFSYVFAAIWCAKIAGRGGDLSEARIAIAIATIISFIIIGREVFMGYRKHKISESGTPHQEGTPEDRESFLGLARLLISALSLIAISYTAYVGWFFRRCI